MTNPTRTVIARGGFAKDVRTGQVVVLKEHGRGNDVMVRPAYKSDGYWLDRADLVPAKDPHAWTPRQGLAFTLVLFAAALPAYGIYSDLTSHGVGALTAIADGAVPAGLLILGWVAKWTGLARV